MKFFLPEWGDYIDPYYDYSKEEFSTATFDRKYSHEVFDSPNFDGLLVSRSNVFKSSAKKRVLENQGVHSFYRLPYEYPILGDCGAFSYIKNDNPPYSTKEIIDYYTVLKFDYGVSLDHILINGDEERRYRLSIDNAKEFIKIHKELGLNWTPVASLQGWDRESIAQAAKEVIQAGYDYIALGGMVRKSDDEIVSYIQEIRDNVSKDVKIHVFGVSRLSIVPEYVRLEVTSSDSASYVRKAFVGENNYYTNSEFAYTAIRIPQYNKNNKAKNSIKSGKVSEEYLKQMESRCLSLFFNKDYGGDLVSSIIEYNDILGIKNYKKKIELTLKEKPWEYCKCKVCENIGSNVILFRGYNRNTSRGMHNVYVYYRDLQSLLRSL